METIGKTVGLGRHIRTDPTYKEWKQDGQERDKYLPCHRTDPTYKEWKLRYIGLVVDFEARTDPTYKEWKQRYLQTM